MQTDMMKANSHFLQFCKHSQKWWKWDYIQIRYIITSKLLMGEQVIVDTEQFRPQKDKVVVYTHTHTHITRIFCQHLTKT